MKKRLLITSIVMMLVVAVALSTATYAWFTSSNTVSATSLSMTAAVNNAAALEINYVNTEGAWQTTIAAVNPEGAFNPAAPSVMAKPIADPATPGTYFSAITWANSDVINGKFKADGTGSQQYVWNDGTGEGKGHTSFFLHNGSTANVISGITVSAEITGPAAPFIRIGVFKNDGSGNFELLGVISNLENYTKATAFESATDYYYYYDTATTSYVKDEEVTSENFATKVTAHGMLYKLNDAYANVTVGEITGNKLVSAMTNPALCTETVAIGGLAVNDNVATGADEMELKIAVWMDGLALNDDTAGSIGKTASIALTFTAAR